MKGRMAADEVDDRRPGPPRVVEIGEAVREPCAEMKKGRSGFLGHAPVAVSGAGCDALVQAEDGAETALAIEACDEMDLGCARVGEANLDTSVDQGPND